MSSENEFRAIIDRIRVGAHTTEDLMELQAAFETGSLRVDVASGGVGIGGDASAAIIVTGNGNTIISGVDAQAIIAVLHQELGSFLDPILQAQRTVEYDTWRTAQNHWIGAGFQSEDQSRAQFGQVLNVADRNITLIQRTQVWDRFDQWYKTWSTNPRPLAVIGQEGDGKTWAVAAWLEQHIATNGDFPPVVFFGSDKVTATDPEKILKDVIEASLDVSEMIAAETLRSWKQKNELPQPWMICVLDGINQHHDPGWWRTLIAGLGAAQWKQRIALIITARTAYWQDNFDGRNTNVYPIPMYNDQELSAALAMYNLTLTELHTTLHPLARRPRFLNLLVKHRERMAESGDVTVARLIYEDWRDRYEKKNHFALNDTEFQALLSQLAEKYRAGTAKLRSPEISQMLPYQDRRVLDELYTSGVFRGAHGKYEVQEDHLVLGLALLLIEELDKAADLSTNSAEKIAQWMEPHAEIDLKGRIAECAALIALQQHTLPVTAQVELLFTWVTHQNIGQTSYPHLTAYFALNPSSYFGLAERVWVEDINLSWVKQILMDTFLHELKRAQGQGKIDLWQQVFERWLGFVHLFDYPYIGRQTEEQAQESYRTIIGRLEQKELFPGPFTFLSYPFTATNNENLLRMESVALRLISHVPRAPFIRAIAIGCLAEAIVKDFSRNYNEFAWVIRSSQETLWIYIQPEVDQLLATNNRIAMQAASRLLSFVGMPEALQRKALLPADLFRSPSLQEEYFKDPCISIFSWRRQDCEHCMGRSDVSPSRIARNIADYCLEPTFPKYPELTNRIALLIQDIDVTKMHIVRGLTEIDHKFEVYEPVLCVYSPDSLASVIHQLVADIPNRTGMALRQVAYEISKHALILSSDEHTILQQAWMNIRDMSDSDDTVARDAEWWLFEIMLSYLEAEEQLTYLISRPKNTLDLSKYGKLFKEVHDWASVWQHLEVAIDGSTLSRLLWFINEQAADISVADITTKVIPLLTYQDSLVRAMVLKIIYQTKELTAINEVVLGKWSWNKDFHPQENNIGSLILCEYGIQLPFSYLIRRVDPRHVGYAIQCRGANPEEVRQYATFLQNLLLRLGNDKLSDSAQTPIVTVESPDNQDRSDLLRWKLADPANLSIKFSTSTKGEDELPSFQDIEEIFDTQKGEQRRQDQLEQTRAFIEQQHKAENRWFDQPMYAQDFVPINDSFPELIQQWVHDVLVDSPEARRRLRLAGSFYDALCIMLLQHNPVIGLELYWKLAATPMHTIAQVEKTKVWSLDYALFEIPVSSLVEESWRQRINTCTTDGELLEVLIAVQDGSKTDWLHQHINTLLATDSPLEFSRGIALLGLLDTEESYAQLLKLHAESPDSWIRVAITTSMDRWQRNSWAKHWFQRFIAIPDTVQAWAAFRLFLRCADRRFWVWRKAMIDRFSLSEERQQFFNLNSDELNNRINKNEKSLTEHFLTQKIADKKLWPWLKGPV